MSNHAAIKLRRYRERNNLTQRDLSITLGKHSHEISQYESGRVIPVLHTIVAIENLTGIAPREWLEPAPAVTKRAA